MRINKKYISSKSMTLVEVLIAIAISLAFLSSVLVAFMQILKTSDISRARLEAINNARSALEIMSIDIKAARINHAVFIQNFLGSNNTLSDGNLIDDDGDGLIDEEVFNGEDDDRDWNAARDDRHISVNGFSERKMYVSQADLGDARVDEDCKFSRDTLRFRIFPDPANPASRDDLISYEVVDNIALYGEPNVLVRRITRNASSGTAVEEVAPIAFKVLSLDLLYWNPNSLYPTWTSSWDASTFIPFTNQIPLPISVYISITIYAGTDDIKKYRLGNKVETITMHTIVNIEQVLNDSRWR